MKRAPHITRFAATSGRLTEPYREAPGWHIAIFGIAGHFKQHNWRTLDLDHDGVTATLQEKKEDSLYRIKRG